MAYNYSKDFLIRHQDLVELLTSAYKGRMAYAKSFGDDSQALTRERSLISNVLRSLALNFPDEYLPMRQAIRTWVTHVNGEWTLHFGVATGVKLAGRPPGEATPTTGWLATGTNNLAPDPETYIHDQVIDSVDSFQRFAGKVLELTPVTIVVQAEFADVLENLEPFEAMFGDHWTVQAYTPTTLQMMRRG